MGKVTFGLGKPQLDSPKLEVPPVSINETVVPSFEDQKEQILAELNSKIDASKSPEMDMSPIINELASLRTNADEQDKVIRELRQKVVLIEHECGNRFELVLAKINSESIELTTKLAKIQLPQIKEVIISKEADISKELAQAEDNVKVIVDALHNKAIEEIKRVEEQMNKHKKIMIMISIGLGILGIFKFLN